MEDAIIGQSVGPYRILEKLGEGGMGIVYRAEDTRLGRQVALKVFPPHLASDEVRLRRFEREARAVAALNHPNIVTLYSVEEIDDMRLITMELIEGRTLSELIWDGLDLEDVLEISLNLADALAAAHDRGITHRDLKPANVMVTTEGHLKVLDFGAAKFFEQEGGQPRWAQYLDDEEPLTVDGAPVGTMLYMSPEQLKGLPVDPRSDIFSLCILIYEMATGNRPFSGGNYRELSSAIDQGTPMAVSLHRADAPDALDRILRKGLEKQRESRYQSVLELRKDLSDLAGVSSETIRSSPLYDSSYPGTPRLFGFPPTTVAGAALVVIATIVWLWLGSATWPDGNAAAATTTESSLAVLPFTNLSGDQRDDDFSAGMTDALRHALSQLEGLRVPARMPIFARARRGVDLRALGTELVLSGSVRRAGTRLRISVQLIRVADGYQLWSETFDCQSEDALTNQDEIAETLVGKIAAELRPAES